MGFRCPTCAVLESSAGSIDVWKLGWGSAYLDAALDAKLELLRHARRRGLPGRHAPGGRRLPGRAEECLDWMAASGFEQIEVSDGLGLLGEDAKTAMIRRAAASFTVVSEVEQKHPTSVMPPATWVELVRADLDAGASAVIAEGRESGTVGMYAADGSARADVVDALLDDIGAERLGVRGAPQGSAGVADPPRGPEVNLGNVAPREVLDLEALRLGLRADTMLAVQSRPCDEMSNRRPAATGRCRWQVGFALTADNLLGHFRGHECYRRTRLPGRPQRRRDGARVGRAGRPGAAVLAGFDGDDPGAAAGDRRRAAPRGRHRRAVTARQDRRGTSGQAGRRGGGSLLARRFLLDPDPIRVHVRGRAPSPAPSCSTRRSGARPRRRPATGPAGPSPVDLDTLVGEDDVVLLPCRGAGIHLDARPTTWTSARRTRLGPARLRAPRQIHTWFYGRAPASTRVRASWPPRRARC